MFIRRRILITINLETLEGLESEIDDIANELQERLSFEVDRLVHRSGMDTELVDPITVDVQDE